MSAAPRSQTREYIIISGEGERTVRGRPVVLPGWEHLALFLHKPYGPGGNVPRLWAVSEVTTGRAIVSESGYGQELTLTLAKNALDSAGREEVDRLIQAARLSAEASAPTGWSASWLAGQGKGGL